MRNSFGVHESEPGRLTLNASMPEWVRTDLRRMGYRLEYQERTSGPINVIWFYGIAW